MKKLLIVTSIISLLGLKCDMNPGKLLQYDTADWITEWFSGETVEPYDLNVDKGLNDVTYPATNSILEDLYPEKYGTNTNSTNSILEDLSPASTSLWVAETNLKLNDSVTEGTWMVKVVEGSDTVTYDTPASGADVTVEFRGSNTEEITGTTGADGWVSWTRPKGEGAMEMYILDIAGDYPWNPLDETFWSSQSALALTQEESQ